MLVVDIGYVVGLGRGWFVSAFGFRVQRWLLAVVSLLVAALTVQLMVRGGANTAVDQVFSNGIYNLIPLLVGACCVLHRSGSRLERRAWVLLGLGVIAWGAGDLYYTVAFYSTPEDQIPYPSLADFGFLAFYPPVLVGLALLVRSRLVHFARSLWIDAVIASLTVAALACAIVFSEVLHTTSGNAAAVATNLAYPLADAILLALVIGSVALARQRLTGSWALILAGLFLFAVSDSVYLVRVAKGTYVYGSLLDVGWLLAMLFLAYASALRSKPLTRERTRDDEAFIPAIPVGFALVNIGLDAWDHFHRVNPLALGLSIAALLLIVARMALSMGENRTLLRTSRQEALTDPLTGLLNRRKLINDLDAVLSPDEERTPCILLLFDLDGFKNYNDSFGHIAGDTLLIRLADRLKTVAGLKGGFAYRLGGDEFCLLTPGTESDIEWLRARATRALAEDGEGFTIRASCGTVVLPKETAESAEGLRIADNRMYAQKSARPAAGKRSMSVLLSVLQERDPELADHTGEVTELAVAVANQFRLSRDEIESVRLAAQLHDIGKIAIPDSILAKPAALTLAEREFMSRHTIIGERIAAADPGLRTASTLIRSSHERWDGAGYPDGLAGTDIPLGSRIVFACDAYDAMTTDRPYKKAVSKTQALQELRDKSGTQFDPRSSNISRTQSPNVPTQKPD